MQNKNTRKQESKVEYNPKEIEKKWQKFWDENKTFKTPELKDLDRSKEKIHVMDMFPYPSGEGLHVGHAKIFTASDVYSRFKRLQGYNVLHAQGFDSFGLPAEQFAIKNKVNPKDSSLKNENTYLAQMKLLGLSYDWDRLIKTTDPEFYKWTQWIFKELYKAGLCYESFEPINWCPSCLTGLANEDLENGLCERCGSVVEKKPIRQWVIRITDYAEKLLAGIDGNYPKPRPLYVDNIQPPKDGLKTTKRQGVLFIIKHWSEDKYLLNISEKYNWKILFTGGIESGESPENAVRREVLEETGYKNIKSVEKINFQHTDNFQRVHKGDNTLVEQTNMFVTLADGEQVERDEEEAAAHKLEWHTREEMSAIIDRRNHKFIFDYAVNNDYSKFEEDFAGYKTEDYFGESKKLDWKESIKEMQRNWIGKNEGVKYRLDIKGTGLSIETYSTHFEAFYADTFAVIAADHKMLAEIVEGVENKNEILKVAKEISDKKGKAGFKELEDHEGIFTGRYLLDPITNSELPLWVSSYALSDYGTGIIKCSAHDSRDFAFAKKYNLPLRVVMYPKRAEVTERAKIDNFEYCYNDFENAILEFPENFKGRNPKEAHADILNYLVSSGFAQKSTQYKLRDWVFARQRYWGEPFPIVFGDGLQSLRISEKTFVDNFSESKVREEFPWVERDAIVAIVKHPTENKYIGLKWKKVAWGTFVTGGIEEGQDASTAAREEVKQETGHYNFKKELNLGLIHSKFFHNPKNVNRYAHINIIYLELENLEKQNVDETENENHEVVWLNEDEVLDFLTPEAHKYVFSEILKSKKQAFVVADSELPVLLPDVKSYEPTGNGESPLANIDDFVDVWGYINSDNEFVSCDQSDERAKLFKRETNTMPQWAGSSWYWLRYMSPHDQTRFVGVEEEKYWSSNGYSVDVYFGGMEHATRHLIYGRFWNQFLYDQKHTTVPEPFKRLEAVGLVLGRGGVKMSKRLGNVVNPDDVVDQFGADTLRLYLSFAGDYHDSFVWEDKNIVGPRRFIERLWNLQYRVSDVGQGEEKMVEKLEILLNQTIKKVTEDYENLKYNTAISQMMIFTNELEKNEVINLSAYKTILKLLSPITPFFTEEVWQRLGEEKVLSASLWPKYDESKIKNSKVNIAVQINGKLRDIFSADVDLTDAEVVEMAKKTEGYTKWVGENTPKKVIVIKNKVINIVV